jgi:hypothetical protein
MMRLRPILAFWVIAFCLRQVHPRRHRRARAVERNRGQTLAPPGVDADSLGTARDPNRVGETTVTTPAEYKAIEGSRTTVAAPNDAVVGGGRYAFEAWSDGGTRVHEVSSTESGTYTATYREVSSPPSGGGGDGGGGEGNGPNGGGGSGAEPVKPGPTKPKLTARPPKQTSSTTARFVFGGVAGTSFRCKLDRGKFVACRSPRTYRRLKPGSHTVRIYATDGTAERSAATVFSWKIVLGA